MKTYVNAVIIQAKPMSRGEYNTLRGWKIPDGEDPDAPGFLRVIPGTEPNTEGFGGHVSWVPADIFEGSHREYGDGKGVTFPIALLLLKEGYRVSRLGWNGKNMFLYYVPGSRFVVNRPPLLGIYPEGTEIGYRDHIDMRTVDGSCVPWVASQTDLLADDWVVA